MTELTHREALRRFLKNPKDTAAREHLKHAHGPSRSEIKTALSNLSAFAKHTKTRKPLPTIKEDGMGAGAVGGGAPLNSAGSGSVAGIGVGPKGEPGVNRKANNSPVIGTVTRKPPKLVGLKEETSFAGHKVFTVNTHFFHRCKSGKNRYTRWEHYVGNDEIGSYIRDYGKNNPKKPIIIQDEASGAMVYLRYGKE